MFSLLKNKSIRSKLCGSRRLVYRESVESYIASLED